MKKSTLLIAAFLGLLFSSSAFCQNQESHVNFNPQLTVMDSIEFGYKIHLPEQTMVELKCPIGGLQVNDGSFDCVVGTQGWWKEGDYFSYTENGCHIERVAIKEMADWKQILQPRL